jgi:polyketide biosynthesis acyl carrier protein
MVREDIIELIGRRTCEVMPQLCAHRFLATDRLIDLGVSSIDRAEIVVLVLETLSLRLPPAATVAARNIGELADLLCRELQHA